MKIKTKDFELMMQYVLKERPEHIDIHQDTFCYTFGFTDAENRTCTIKLFETSANTTPELVKSMKLYTRFKDTKKKEDSDE